MAKKSSGGTPACVKKHAKSSGKSVSTLNKVYKRGLGAYYSSGSVTSRPVPGRVVASDPSPPAKAGRAKQIQTF